MNISQLLMEKSLYYMNAPHLNSEYQISSIYYKQANPIDCIVYVINKRDEDVILQFNPFVVDSIKSLAPWDYNIDDYDFEHLQNGYQIAYMPIEIHYGFWNIITTSYDDFINRDGMQKYFTYCREEGLTKEVIEKKMGLELNMDIIETYTEETKDILAYNHNEYEIDI